MRAPATIRRQQRESAAVYGGSIDGATARVVEPSLQPAVEQSQRRRTVLSIVPAVTRNRRLPFLLMCVAFLIAALTSVLLLNIQVSSGQYELVKLRSAQTSLVQENEALTQEVQYLEAPQNIASKAAELGMVPAGNVAAIDLSTGEVSGVATAAGSEDTVTSLLSGPERPFTEPAPVSSVGSGTDNPPASGAESSSPASESAGAEKPAEEPQTPAQGSKPTFSSEELNGGTIPAPQVSDAHDG
ncbi:hypothetical protein [Zhihengliuella flava]|uniref:Cell division protein FtsL n=1 Tax=Zhihengliuella flava TaxID=1285193 RepID=A0A931GJR5_9MICC|nr:hypothetical protein [Zhihengliuella flava]MBG6085626.1 cell division protein FtsL [Zhihengliuella flava]